MEKHQYMGSSLDDFLEEEGFLEHCESIAAKRAFVQQFQKGNAKTRNSKNRACGKNADKGSLLKVKGNLISE